MTIILGSNTPWAKGPATSYGINARCFENFISKNGNYPAPVYYSVNNHIYIVRERKKAQSLIGRAKDMETKIETDMVEDKMEEEENSFKNRDIYGNVAVEDLTNERYKTTDHLQ